ncbi:hypothetical protein GLOIN_2v1600672 [Rhizophagus irregularis DAOM 181602=DAOM 197198]|uniref:Uncharacterized protein n=1 Tax=Rhizophagus irregularis (strain DAOM 181602 / DAOM 197198 / MUCL 43194) TaxID=747089 RepID=A0A2P4Q2U9_RHIID|nr:hypothetical protein GLOIN_2v1600672 [Rhizophagus irregularis DAOM 181602=DAOM 197198]POG71977.1 hypothetical protein GLOIN_2v1600672 [Rhizophagus irregularis DAOM 181602=DAOM 197198]|eukprot:XP_025178843.1 hypothetical protein GLOIN_2v1600672 [Rhizophagus irregularis DAOM 181602=DAOM 197198]
MNDNLLIFYIFPTFIHITYYRFYLINSNKYIKCIQIHRRIFKVFKPFAYYTSKETVCLFLFYV